MKLLLYPSRLIVLAAALVISTAAAAAVHYSDPWITGKVKMALMLSSEIDATDLFVDTVDRVVTLHGSVPTDRQRGMVEELANDVTGVRAVRNLVRVVPREVEAAVAIGDDALRRRVDWALGSDPWLADSSLRVESVTKGFVVIGGRAASMSDHLRALTLVRSMQGVNGVSSVVESPDVLSEREILRSESPAGRFDEGSDADAQVTSRVKLALADTADVASPNIHVDTRDGVVTLFGTVTDAGMEQRVVDTVLAVTGVTRVRDDLAIVTTAPREKSDVSDADLASRVSQFLDSAGDAFTGIRASVNDGAVRLEGRVPREATRLAAVIRVRAVPGVRRVSENLRVVGNEAAASTDGKGS